LWEVLAEEGFQLLDPFDQGHHDVACSSLIEITWTERQNVLVEIFTQIEFDLPGCAIADGFANILQRGPQQNTRRHPCDRQEHCGKRSSLKH
jgi:hypothetical protein